MIFTLPRPFQKDGAIGFISFETTLHKYNAAAIYFFEKGATTMLTIIDQKKLLLMHYLNTRTFRDGRLHKSVDT